MQRIIVVVGRYIFSQMAQRFFHRVCRKLRKARAYSIDVKGPVIILGVCLSIYGCHPHIARAYSSNNSNNNNNNKITKEWF